MNEDYAPKGPAPAEEKVERERIFKAGYAAKKSVGTVHVYILDPEGRFYDSLHVAEAAKPKKLEAALRNAITELKLRPGPPLVKPRPQSCPPSCDSDSLVLHLVSRSVDGKGAWTDFPGENWIVLTPAEQRKLLPAQQTAVGATWKPDTAVAQKLFQYFYPATENNAAEKNRFRYCAVTGTVLESKGDRAKARLEGRFEMDHSFYHKEDGKIVTAAPIGFVEFNPNTGRILSLQMTTREAEYNGGKFAVAVASQRNP